MAPRPPLRRRPGAVPAAAVAALAALAILTGLGALAFGRPAPGGLRDDGPHAVVTPPASAKPLWPDLATAPPLVSPTGGSATQAPPQPVPDLVVPGHDLTAVDVRTLLGKDPGLSPEERRALGSCTDCEVRAPEFRDLTGDGRPELITAVTAPGTAVLHVYTLVGEHVLPILQVQVQPQFSAATVDSDLWLYEPTTYNTRTTSQYHWDGSRLALVGKQVDGVGLLPPTDPTTDQPSVAGAGAARSTATARPTPAAKPSSGVTLPRPVQPTPQPPGPTAVPEAKR
ncbi:hypothetical protein AB0O91_38775 [Kitasatospora sp. NPDC089797]|uniref:hypothetical protein n=1 Tax=Kitasatospora sp. NPDC089797 TaxID=3155298 RepID=UPI003442B6DE